LKSCTGYGCGMNRLLLALVFGFLWASMAKSQVALEGTFTASKSCPALASIRKNANPGDVSVETGTSYAVQGKNRENASHYWITIPGADPERRWVAVGCGQLDGGNAEPTATPSKKPAEDKGKKASRGDFYILALSWQPAFCEGKPDKPECQRNDIDGGFSLHGLWPQPRRNVFCGVEQPLIAADEAGDWGKLPEPDLSSSTRQALDSVMPGTQSLLHRHEWIKHGTCYPGDAEDYYRDSVRLTADINASAVGAFMRASVGDNIRSSDLRAKFDEAFGAGAGDRVRVSCKRDGGRELIVEITVGLRGEIAAGANAATLIRGSSPTDPGCPGGVVDPVGFQ
jgi:ribonuclease T2